MLALLILFAFSAGLLFRKFGQPPLLGYLLAGFAAHAMGIGNLDLLGPVAEIGVTMLLFTIGLKLRITELAKPYIFGCLLYTSPSPRDATLSRMPSSA